MNSNTLPGPRTEHVVRNAMSVILDRANDEKSVHAGFAVALAMLVSIAAFSYYSLVGMEQSADLVDHTYQVQTSIAEIDADYSRVRNRWRSYITDASPTALATYKSVVAGLEGRIDVLQLLLADSAKQLSRLSAVRQMITSNLASLDEVIERKRSGKLEDGAAIISELIVARPIVAKTNRELGQMAEEEARLLAMREHENLQQSAGARGVLIVGTTLSIALLVLAFFLMSRQMRRFRSAQVSIAALNGELQKHAEHLEATNKELESFSYSVSHDLRAPLRAIGGYARILEEDCGPQLDEDGKRYLGIVSSESARMGRLIDDLLAFSRLGRQPVTVAMVDMTGLVSEVIGDISTDAGSTAHILAEPLPAAAGDRSLLRQVWINLIGNAHKYSSKRERPQVSISGATQGDTAVYRVQDNGAGFEMRHYDKLFGVFQRLHGTDEFPGTGIGLAIVQRIVARHGGRVWAEGEVDRGATFYFSLPGSITTDVKHHDQ